MAIAGMLAWPGCSDCTDLADEARSLKETWQACAPGDVCVAVAGDHRDCTGHLGCTFAVRDSYAAEARAESTRIASESEDCSSCAMAECACYGDCQSAPVPSCVAGRCRFQ